LFADNLTWLELKGHGSTILVSSVGMFLISIFGGIIGSSGSDIIEAGTLGLSSGYLSLAAVIFTALPSMLAGLGVYAIVNASEGILRREAGLYSSQGIERYRVLSAWSVTLSAIPFLCYLAGFSLYVFLTPGSSLGIANGASILVSASTALLAVRLRLSSVTRDAYSAIKE
jgi:hypothetical protein